jgi:hypothetical protein
MKQWRSGTVVTLSSKDFCLQVEYPVLRVCKFFCALGPNPPADKSWANKASPLKVHGHFCLVYLSRLYFISPQLTRGRQEYEANR